MFRTYSTAPRCFSSRSRSADALILFNLKRSLHTGCRLPTAPSSGLGQAVLSQGQISDSAVLPQVSRPYTAHLHKFQGSVIQQGLLQGCPTSLIPRCPFRLNPKMPIWPVRYVRPRTRSCSTDCQRSVTPDQQSPANSASSLSMPPQNVLGLTGTSCKPCSAETPRTLPHGYCNEARPCNNCNTRYPDDAQEKCK